MAKRKSAKSKNANRKIPGKSSKKSGRIRRTGRTKSHKVSKKSLSKALVKIYTIPTCPYCRMAKSFLASKKIRYVEMDVTSDPKYIRELKSRSGQLGVPVIDIGGRIVIGFDERRIRKLLKIYSKGH